jgi:hypothetical protein
MVPSASSPASGIERTSSRAIVIVSIGARPWIEYSKACFERYGKMHNIDIFVESEYPTASEFPMPDLPDNPGRNNKLAYACKTFFAWKYLACHGFEQVLIVDDSCCIRPSAPDPFKLVPLDCWGITRTSSHHALDITFTAIKEFIGKTGAAEIEYVVSDYMNSGVILYGAETVAAIEPDKICACAELLFSRAPHQTLTYFLMKSGGVRSFHLPKAFNVIPTVGRLSPERRQRLKDVVPFLRDDIFISHITGFHRHRDILIRQIAETYMKEFDSIQAERSLEEP